MRVVNYSDFRNNLAQSLNAVNDDAIQETLHLTSNAINRQRLTESLQEMHAGTFKTHKLVEK
jgi:antitoxin YefM